MSLNEKKNYGFTGIPTFLRANYVPLENIEERNPEIVVLGIPFDEGAPFVAGSRLGPRSIREHSLRFGGPGIYDFKKDQILEIDRNKMADIGDIDVVPTDVSGTFNKITEAASKVFKQGAMLISIGGDHSITYPVVRAIEEPMHLIHFDAHADFLPIEPGFEHTNSHAFTHINEMDHVKSMTLIGYRSVRESSGIQYKAAGNKVIGMDEFRGKGPENMFNHIPKGEACYVTIDIDALDSSLIPGCVSAEPDGMFYRELKNSLVAIAENHPIIGFELVEVSPQLDVGTGITSYIAALTMVEFLANIIDNKHK